MAKLDGHWTINHPSPLLLEAHCPNGGQAGHWGVDHSTLPRQMWKSPPPKFSTPQESLSDLLDLTGKDSHCHGTSAPHQPWRSLGWLFRWLGSLSFLIDMEAVCLHFLFTQVKCILLGSRMGFMTNESSVSLTCNQGFRCLLSPLYV